MIFRTRLVLALITASSVLGSPAAADPAETAASDGLSPAGTAAAGTGAGTVRRGPVTNLPMPRFVSLDSEARLRRGPGLDHRIDWILRHPGTPLQIVAEFDNWRKVVDADGTGGWIHYTLLRGTRTVVVRAPEVTLRETALPTAPAIAVLEQGVIARLEACTPDWCEVEVGGYDGWLPKTEIWGVGETEIRE